jgi:hypothetical protein
VGSLQELPVTADVFDQGRAVLIEEGRLKNLGSRAGMRHSFCGIWARGPRRREESLMRRQIGLLSLVGTFGLLGAAVAQTPSPPAVGAAFDGTYRFVSSAKVNATYVARNGQMGPCPDRRAGPLHVVKGKAHYTNATGYRLTGTVGPQGELAMRVVAPPNTGNAGSHPIDIIVNGTIDGTGTAHARQSSNSCSYDFTWRK